MNVERTDIAPFGALDLQIDERTTVSLGELELEVVRRSEEVQFRSWMKGEEPEEEDWVRWAVGPDERMRLDPATPDRLVVVSPEHAFHLPPKGTARNYMRLPVFVRLVLVGGNGGTTPIADLPTSVLSDTWWGSFTEGELGYWLTTKARRHLSDDLFVPHYAMSAFTLRNASTEALPVESFAVRVRHLGIFQAQGRLWTGDTLVRYDSASLGSEIRFTGNAPPEAEGATKLTEPRDPQTRGFHARTFRRLKSLSNLSF